MTPLQTVIVGLTVISISLAFWNSNRFVDMFRYSIPFLLMGGFLAYACRNVLIGWRKLGKIILIVVLVIAGLIVVGVVFENIQEKKRQERIEQERLERIRQFDPEEYLKKNKKFDPDEYLKKV